jgi:mRNA interferase MazF
MLMMLNMTNFDFGDIVLVSFPFTNQQGFKQRPAVVISSKVYNRTKSDLILMAITSQTRLQNEFAAISIQHWQQGGLLKESVIKPVIFTVEKSLIKKVLGFLSETDKQRLKQTLALIVGESFS